MNFGKGLVILGLSIAAIGLIVWIAPKVPGLDRLGRLPGDIRIEGKNGGFYFPIVTCILVSLVLSLLFRLFR